MTSGISISKTKFMKYYATPKCMHGAQVAYLLKKYINQRLPK